MQEADDNNLDLYTSEDLIRALSSRFDSLVFVGSQTKTKTAQDLTFCSIGPFHSCLGLVETAKLLVTTGGISE